VAIVFQKFCAKLFLMDKIAAIKKFFPKNLRKKLPRGIVVKKISSRESRRLNLVYRGKNVPTNVLSFRYGPDYGEILICPAVAKKEAKISGNSQTFQMTWMIAHGMIHLSGLHHKKTQDASARFAGLEKKILDKFLSPELRSKN